MNEPLVNLADLRRITEIAVSLSGECLLVRQGVGPTSLFPTGLRQEELEALDCD